MSSRLVASDLAPIDQPVAARRRGAERRWRRPPFRRNPQLYLGIGMVLLVTVVALLAPWLAPHDPLSQQLSARMKPPGWYPNAVEGYPLGTDEFGRDLWSRILYGARVSLAVGVLAVVLAGPLGTAVGLLAGYLGGWVETVLMRLADAQLALPGVLLAIIVVAVLGPSVANLVLVLAVSSWVIYARIIYTTTRGLRERDFILAARALGVDARRIMLRHVLPNTLSPIIVLSALQVGRLILLEAALSFLGLGVPPPEPSWGGMLADGRNRLLVAPWIGTLPGIALVVTVWGINMLGDGLRQYLDPRFRTV